MDGENETLWPLQWKYPPVEKSQSELKFVVSVYVDNGPDLPDILQPHLTKKYTQSSQN